MARILAIISFGVGVGAVMSANGRRFGPLACGWLAAASGVAAGMLVARAASRLALRVLSTYCGSVPVWVFLPLECELLLWVAALDGSTLRAVLWTVQFFTRSI